MWFHLLDRGAVIVCVHSRRDYGRVCIGSVWDAFVGYYSLAYSHLDSALVFWFINLVWDAYPDKGCPNLLVSECRLGLCLWFLLSKCGIPAWLMTQYSVLALADAKSVQDWFKLCWVNPIYVYNLFANIWNYLFFPNSFTSIKTSPYWWILCILTFSVYL